MTKDQKKVNKNIGFIPCPKCSKKIIQGKETLKSLIKNRACTKPFGKAITDTVY